ncbi:MAG: small nuclear ribonucleoprotein [Candidatus Micrarchaeota archaeon]|nr:small nuclear ribonucleoprotein [Candidatus Micrarchaeota archaeon]
MTEKRPFDILNSSLNNNVIVGIKGGREIRGLMVSYDVHMNIVIEKAEVIEMERTPEGNKEKVRGLGTVLLRGDSVVYISPA